MSVLVTGASGFEGDRKAPSPIERAGALIVCGLALLGCGGAEPAPDAPAGGAAVEPVSSSQLEPTSSGAAASVPSAGASASAPTPSHPTSPTGAELTIGETAFGWSRGDVVAATSSEPPAGVPKVRPPTTGPASILPPEVIRRVIRKNHGSIRLCYQAGLRSSPELEGQVVVKFTIERDGTVSAATGSGGLPDADTVACIASAFRAFRFPTLGAHDSLRVTYPIRLEPGG